MAKQHFRASASAGTSQFTLKPAIVLMQPLHCTVYLHTKLLFVQYISILTTCTINSRTLARSAFIATVKLQLKNSYILHSFNSASTKIMSSPPVAIFLLVLLGIAGATVILLLGYWWYANCIVRLFDDTVAVSPALEDYLASLEPDIERRPIPAPVNARSALTAILEDDPPPNTTTPRPTPLNVPPPLQQSKPITIPGAAQSGYGTIKKPKPVPAYMGERENDL